MAQRHNGTIWPVFVRSNMAAEAHVQIIHRKSQRIVNLSRITLSTNCFLSSTDTHIIINQLFIGNTLLSDIFVLFISWKKDLHDYFDLDQPLPPLIFDVIIA